VNPLAYAPTYPVPLNACRSRERGLQEKGESSRRALAPRQPDPHPAPQLNQLGDPSILAVTLRQNGCSDPPTRLKGTFTAGDLTSFSPPLRGALHSSLMVLMCYQYAVLRFSLGRILPPVFSLHS